MDRFVLPGVDVVADLDASLPFGNDIFDEICANHSLEHVADLGRTLAEIWRVGRPGARLTVVAPYWAQAGNVVNPFHRHHFSEHSPRFWTDSPRAPLPLFEFAHPPQGSVWGLASSDNSAPPFDLRCVGIEFLYFEEFWGLEPEELAGLRRRLLEVCEQIVFRLVVFKPPLAEGDLETFAGGFHDPAPVVERRRRAAAASPRRFSWRRLFRRLRELGRA